MATLSLTYPTVTDGVTVVGAIIHNTNWSECVAAVNGIDHTNIGAAGLWATNLLAPNATDGTFTSGTTGAGFTFKANDATAVALTVTSAASSSANSLAVNMGTSQSVAGLLVNGASSITGNIFECDLTSGGTVAAALTSAGVLNIGSQTVQSTTAGDLQAGRSASSAVLWMGGATHAGVMDYGVSNGQQFTLYNSGANTGTLNIGKTGSYGNGAIAIGSNSSYSIFQSTSGTVSGTSVAGTLTGFYAGASLIAALATGGNLGILGTLSSSSLRSLKTNIEPLKGALELNNSVQFHWFNYKSEEENIAVGHRHIGYMAEETDTRLSGPGHGHGYEPGTMAALACASIQEVCEKLKAAGIAGF